MLGRKADSWAEKQANKQTNKQNKTKQKKYENCHICTTCRKYVYRLFFKGLVSFYRLGGGVEDFWENTWLEGERGGGERGENQLSPKDE